MVEFLSDAWIARLDAAARGAEGLVADPPFTVGTRVHSAGGDRGYVVRFAPAGASVTGTGPTDDAGVDVVLTTDPGTAWALHQGTVRAQDAFARGLLKVRGRAELLAAHGELFATFERALAPVRVGTTPPARFEPRREHPPDPSDADR